MSEAITFEISESMIDAIAARVAERLGDVSSAKETGYLDVAGAADFLVCPSSRIYALVSSDRIPHHRDGSRLLFDPTELRAYVANGGAKRP